jgi:hypothetical protein
MWVRKISVGFDRPLTPHNRLLVTAKEELCEACVIHPDVSRRIVRTEAQGLDDMSLRFFCATDESLANSDGEMRVGKISIQRQRMFAFSDTRLSPLGEYVDESQCHMAERMVRD